MSDMTERWCAVSSSVGESDSCYLFTCDGLIIERHADGTKAPVATWSTEDEECLSVISSPVGDIEILGEDGDGCVIVTYDDQNMTICGC